MRLGIRYALVLLLIGIAEIRFGVLAQADCIAKQNGSDLLPDLTAEIECKGKLDGFSYLNDYSYLDDADNVTYQFGDCWKRLYAVDDRWVDIGGSLRLRFHDERNLGRQVGTELLDPAQSNPLLLQHRLFADFHSGSSWRVFVEGLYADVVAQNTGYRPRRIERNRGDLLNLFIEFPVGQDSIVRLGRQQMKYGSRRLIAGPGWAGTSRNHDGAKWIGRWDNCDLDVFYVRPVTIDVDDFDPIGKGRDLFGVWHTMRHDTELIDLYYVGFDDELAQNQKVLHNIGGRIKGGSDLLYEIEVIGQFGKQRTLGLEHSALMFVAGIGKKLEMPWKPSLWCYFDFATGDEDDDATFTRYDRIFDRAHTYLGLVDTVLRSNVEIYSLALTVQPTERLEVLSRYYRIFANEQTDIVPALAGAVATQRFDTDDYGQIIDLEAKYKVGCRSDWRLGFSWFLPVEKPISQSVASLMYVEWNQWF